MATRERSAGIVVFRTDVSESPPRRIYLLLDYGRHWDFPKGHVEDGEDDMAAALRELKEETSLEGVRVIPNFAREIRYFFRKRRTALIDKKVIFFAAEDTSEKEPVLSCEHVGWELLPFDRAMRRLTYATARQVLRDVDEFLNKS